VSRITVLNELTVSQIAAGEVIERPAMVVKELVENAVDAGAEKIEIHLSNGGRQKIHVIDNGEGMDREDASLALERHATSKIREIDDLHHSSYLGFRGEALPSIAAVSRLVLQTAKETGNPGVKIIAEGGEILTCEEVGTPKGTTVVVENLFFNTPARLKFLKSIPSELTRIKETVTSLAVGYPEISFRLNHQGSELLYTMKGNSLAETIEQVFGPALFRELIQVKGSYGPLNIQGYIGRPTVARANRQQQYFFLNRRLFRSRLISSAAEKAYGTLLPVARFPFLLLNLELPSELADVNVHPNKLEVRFTDEKEIYRGIFHILRDNLQSELIETSWVPDYQPKSRLFHPSPEQQKDPPAPACRENTVLWPENGPAKQETISNFLPQEERREEAAAVMPAAGSLFQTYLLFEERDAVLLVDQHAAHERVIYDRLQKKRGEQGQYFLTPAPVELTRDQFKIAKEQKKLLDDLGFEYEPFSGQTVLLRSAPLNVSPGEGEELFLTLLEEWGNTGEGPRDYREKALSLIACKQAVKAGQSLSPVESAQLLKDLRQTELPQTCPHGRPTMVYLHKADIERMFRRR